jgi:hypothetical protein
MESKQLVANTMKTTLEYLATDDVSIIKEAIDIRYITVHGSEYKQVSAKVEVFLSLGGPNIWITYDHDLETINLVVAWAGTTQDTFVDIAEIPKVAEMLYHISESVWYTDCLLKI